MYRKVFGSLLMEKNRCMNNCHNRVIKFYKSYYSGYSGLINYGV